MEHFVLYCIVMSLAVLISIVIARPEIKTTTPQDNNSPTILPSHAAPQLSSFVSWRKRLATDRAKSENNHSAFAQQLELFAQSEAGA